MFPFLPFIEDSVVPFNTKTLSVFPVEKVNKELVEMYRQRFHPSDLIVPNQAIVH